MGHFSIKTLGKRGCPSLTTESFLLPACPRVAQKVSLGLASSGAAGTSCHLVSGSSSIFLSMFYCVLSPDLSRPHLLQIFDVGHFFKPKGLL